MPATSKNLSLSYEKKPKTFRALETGKKTQTRLGESHLFPKIRTWKTMITPRPTANSAFAVLLSLSGCLQPGTSRDAGTTSVVSSTGGRLEFNGARFDFPAGAVDSPITVAITEVAVILPTGLTAVGPAWRLRPEGAQFEKPVRISLPITSTSASMGMTLRVATAHLDSTDFELLDAKRDGDTLFATTVHFSYFVPVAQPDPDAGFEVDAGADAGLCGLPGDALTTCDNGHFAKWDGGCALYSACGDALRREMWCDEFGCGCSVDDVRISVSVPSDICGDAGVATDFWSCGCGFPTLGPLRCTGPQPVPVKPLLGSSPGAGSYPPGTFCAGGEDCHGPNAICLNTTLGKICTVGCAEHGVSECPCEWSVCRPIVGPGGDVCMPPGI